MSIIGNADAIEHPVEDLVAQRVYGLCLGYEDLNDHDQLRADPVLAAMVGKTDLKGEHRREARDRGKALAGKSTLNRLELTRADASAKERYKKISMSPEMIDQLMVDYFVEAQNEPPQQIILDLDAPLTIRYTAIRGRPILSRLLRLLLLSAVIHLLR